MTKKQKQLNNDRKDIVVLLFLIPVSFIVLVLSYKLLVGMSKDSSKICTFLGRIWFAGNSADPSVRRGCFTYQELYSEE